MLKLIPKATVAVVVLLLVGGLLLLNRGSGYDAQVTLDSATNVVKGGPVLVNGFEAGHVTDIKLVDGRAVVSFRLDGEHGPLHAGAEINVDWKAALSERLLSITDGPKGNAAIPDGGMVIGNQLKPTEIDEILNALDAPTRKRLQSLTGRLAETLESNEGNLHDTVAGAGTTMEAVGELLKALGTDGPAIEHLVTRVNATMEVLSARDSEVGAIVSDLTSLTGVLAERRENIRDVLKQLPSTLEQARTTLDKVPATADQVVPLLKELGPATESLKPVADNLTPILRDLRPLTADLRPTLDGLATLLGITPGLLDITNSTLPDLQTTVEQSRTPLQFIRPFTPEIIAYPSLWASAFANYDSYGNFARLHLAQGGTSLNENPGILPPGTTYDPFPDPGAIVGQPWTDATGSEMR